MGGGASQRKSEAIQKRGAMSSAASVIVSYDGTNNEDDAVALGRLFAEAGAEVALAYVRHSNEPEEAVEALVEQEAEELLRRGAALLGGHEVGRHVVTDRSTPAGLHGLAERVGANAIVFCSDSHTAQGHIAIGNSAQRLLEGGGVAIAIAPAGYTQILEEKRPQVIAASGDGGDPSPRVTAEALAGALDASVTETVDESAGLLVLGSRPEVEQGRVGLSAATQNLIEEVATYPVLVLPRGVSISFGRFAGVSA
jgi:nucleotide-binding universal stress UspA family protein